MNDAKVEQSSTRKTARIFTMQNDNPKENNLTSDSDSDPGVTDWNRELINAICQTEGESEKDPEEHRIHRIKTCLSEGADINTTHGKNHDTILHTAIKKNYQKIVAFLIKREARTDITNKKGLTAITLAETLGNEAIVSILNYQQRKPAIDESSAANEAQSVHDQQPSTSRETKISSRRCVNNQGLNANRITLGSKRKPITDGKDHQRIKKRRSKLHNVRPHESQSSSGSNLDFGRTSAGENLNPSSRFDRKTTYPAGGLTSSFHGVVYQLKHLGYTLLRGMQEERKKMEQEGQEIRFLLSAERVDVGKFDDLVLEYRNNPGKDTDLFLQLKHSRSAGKQVNAYDLLEKEDGDFFLPKYFRSWREIKKSPLFSDDVSRNVVLGTNIGLNLDELGNARISYEEISKPVECLEMIGTKEDTKCYKLTANVQFNRKIYAALKERSDVYMLARELVKHVVQGKKMTLVGMFKQYHTALGEHVIDTRHKKFFQNFIKNKDLPPKTENFRNIFFDEFSKLRNRDLSNDKVAKDVIWKEIEDSSLKLSKNFSKPFELPVDSNTELPVDDITEVDITEFLNVFIIAVNLPNEVELGQMITDEIGNDSKFNLLDTDLIGHTFLTRIMDWFKGKGNKVGKGEYLTYKGGEDFFKEMEDQINALTSTGIGSVYWKKLMKYDVHFECENTKLKAFLSENELNPTPHRILMLMAPKELLLTALRVRQALLQVEKFARNDSFIFIRLRTLSLPGIKDQVVQAFQSQRSHHLLVIECDSASMKQDLWELSLSLCKAVQNINYANKTVILILRGDKGLATSLAVQFETVYETHVQEDDDTSFRNLTKASQHKMLEKQVVKFQGYGDHTSFRRLLDVELDEIGMNEWYDVAEILDANTLISLIRGNDEIRIGNDLKGLDEVENYYIHRRIVRHVAIRKDIFQDRKRPDILVISGISKESWGNLERFEETVLMDRNLNSEQEVEHFETLRKQNPNRNIHWLKEESSKYIWKRSVGDITYLLRYRDANENDGINDRAGATYSNEDQFTAHDRPVIVSDTAGMGKSTMFTYLARKLKETESDLLVLKIDLNRHTNALAKVKKSTSNLGDTTKAVKFLLEELLHFKKGLEYKVFKAIIEKQRRTALIFDAFDEISPHYEDIVIDLLDALSKHTGIRKLFVATRPHIRGILEERLKTFSHALEPFSAPDQKSFLINFWRNELGLEESDQTAGCRLQMYADAILAKLANSIGDRMNEFTGIPLQTKLVAEIFKNQNSWERQNFTSCKEFINSTEDEPNLPNKFDLIFLYTNFVEMRYEFFFNKRECNHSDPAVMEDREKCHKEFMNTHENLALDALFDEDTVNACLPVRTEVHSVVERTGIITNMIEGKPHFGHRTYAEFFAANFLSDKLKEGIWNPSVRRIFLADILLKANYRTLRAFLNDLLPNKDNDLRDCESWKYDWKDYRSENNETLLHVASTEGNHRIIQLFLNHISKDSRDRIALINATDRFGTTAVKIATRFGYVNIIELLRKHGNIELNSTFDHKGRTLLHVAVKYNRLNVVRYLVEHGADIESRDRTGSTPLPLAAIKNNSNIVRYLVEHGADIKSRDKTGSTPLSLAAMNGHSDLVRYLVEHGADIQSQDKEGSTPLFFAATRGKLETVIYLHEQGADIQSQDVEGSTPLSLAAMYGNSDIVWYLVEHGADIQSRDEKGSTPLSLAAMNGNSDLVRYLVEHGADIQSQDKEGSTPLFFAAMNGHSDIVWYLVEHGADIQSRNKEGSTLLSLATMNGNSDLVRYLVEHGADIQSRDKNGRTPLFFAAMRGKLETVIYLHEQGADIQSQDVEGSTPLSLAAMYGNSDIVWYLVEHGADIQSRDEKGSTPLSLAAMYGNSDIVRYLVEHVVDI